MKDKYCDEDVLYCSRESIKTDKHCSDCKYCYTNDSLLDGLYICVNGKSELVREWTGMLAPACEDFVAFD